MPNYPATAPVTPRHRSDDLVDSASLARCTGHYYSEEEMEMRAMGITLPICPRHEDSEYVGRHVTDTFLPHAAEVSSLDY